MVLAKRQLYIFITKCSKLFQLLGWKYINVQRTFISFLFTRLKKIYNFQNLKGAKWCKFISHQDKSSRETEDKGKQSASLLLFGVYSQMHLCDEHLLGRENYAMDNLGG